MGAFGFSEHAYEMLIERNIRESWVRLAMENPERTQAMEDGTVHYIRPIAQHGGGYLRVVVNPHVEPPRVVTVFFDRTMRSLQ